MTLNNLEKRFKLIYYPFDIHLHLKQNEKKNKSWNTTKREVEQVFFLLLLWLH